MNKIVNAKIITDNIVTILEQGIFSNRCKTAIFTATWNGNKTNHYGIDNTALSALLFEQSDLFKFDYITLSKMFTIKIDKNIVGVNLTQVGRNNLMDIGYIVKPMHFNDLYFSKNDIDNYYNTLVNVPTNTNYGTKNEYFIGEPTNDIIRDKNFKQDIIYRGIVTDGIIKREIKRYCQCKFFDKLSSTANMPIDFNGIFGMDKNSVIQIIKQQKTMNINY